MEHTEITVEKVEALVAKHQRGVELEDAERQILQEHVNLESYRVRKGGHDFAEVECQQNGGRIQELALRERNRRCAERNPHRRDPDPTLFKRVAGSGVYFGAGIF